MWALPDEKSPALAGSGVVPLAGHYHCSPFTDEETKAREVKMLPLRPKIYLH
jgi:hypothetical protein